MNNIIEIARRPEVQDLCNRCLGRLFGKLGHGLDNPTRGRVIRLVLALNEQLNTSDNKKVPIDQDSITDFIEKFEFTSHQMALVENIPGIDLITSGSEKLDNLNEVPDIMNSKETIRNQDQGNYIESIISNDSISVKYI